jgi:hypothetical protein
MTDEVWKAVVGFSDYEVSSQGRVRRSRPDRHGRMSRAPLTPALGNHGYHVVSLHKDARQVVRMVHRIVCEAFHGPAPSPVHQAAHGDGVRTNNLAANLRWATPAENNLDKHRHGTMRTGEAHHAIANPACMPRGGNHGNAKLTDEAVASIRADSRPQRVIAAEYGVAQSLISLIKNRKIWAHLAPEESDD